MLYGLKVQISIGENLLIGVAEATACYAAALPQPQTPKITSEKLDKSDKERNEIDRYEKLFKEEMTRNKKFFNLFSEHTKNANNKYIGQSSFGSNNEFDMEQFNLFKIELDDIKEKDEAFLLIDQALTKRPGVYACNTESMPGINTFNKNLQMFTSVYRCETSLNQMTTFKFIEINDEILKSLQYKFRKTPLYCFTNLSFDVSLFDDDHAMIIVTGSCLIYSEVEKETTEKKSSEHDSVSPKTINQIKTSPISLSQFNKKSLFERSYVEISHLSYVPSAQIESYLGHVNLFFIRESKC